MRSSLGKTFYPTMKTYCMKPYWINQFKQDVNTVVVKTNRKIPAVVSAEHHYRKGGFMIGLMILSWLDGLLMLTVMFTAYSWKKNYNNEYYKLILDSLKRKIRNKETSIKAENPLGMAYGFFLFLYYILHYLSYGPSLIFFPIIFTFLYIVTISASKELFEKEHDRIMIIAKREVLAETNEIEETKNGYKKCQYCSTRNDETKSRCCSCGAPL